MTKLADRCNQDRFISYLCSMNLNKTDLHKEVIYKASRSSGAGGQHVNKVSSRVELLFSVSESTLFSNEEKERINQKLQSRLNRDGFVQIFCDEERSQYLNKEKALERLLSLIITALHQPKPRKPTTISRTMKAARLEGKRHNAQKKESRRKNFGTGE